MPTLQIGTATFRYQPNSAHRNGRAGKSQWTVSRQAELGTFSDCVTSNWGGQARYWGLFRANGNVSYLGLDRDHSTALFIAQFDGKSQPQIWHGYPVNHRDHRPPDAVLNSWLEHQVLSPAKISKIVARKKCKL